MIVREFSPGSSQLGYSLLEMIIVIVAIGLLAAAGLKYYIGLREEALRTAVQTQARNFAGAIQVARADWLTRQIPGSIPTQPGHKLALDLDGTQVYVNELGWPANTSAELDSSSDTQTPAECYELWVGLMQNPQPATVEGLSGASGERGQRRYHVSTSEENCRFESVNDPWSVYYFDYNLKTGKVLTDEIIK
jgi:prepilin-type N-terminal cleavage/methylation domain-containing protein